MANPTDSAELFEHGVTSCIRQHNPDAQTISELGLPCKTIHVPGQNIIYHLLPIPFRGLESIPPPYFQEKTLEYARRGVRLIHLWQDSWVMRQEIVCSRIAALSGSSIRIHARLTDVQRITKSAMHPFMETNHLQGAVSARYSYALFHGSQMVAAASFSPPRTITRGGVACRSFELLRFANLLHHTVVGGLGKLINRFIHDVNPDDVMTFADLDWAPQRNNGYQLLNFVQTSLTPPLAFMIRPPDMIRYYPHRLPAALINEFRSQNTCANMDEFLKSRKYVRIYNAGNLKYLLRVPRCHQV